jgi:phosphoribosylformylglycinamidine cyclo-ligase
LLFDRGKYAIDALLPELSATLGEVLLEPHLNYARPVQQLLAQQVSIKGMAHITGGGFLENIPRILPQHCSVEILKNTWPQQAIFSILQGLGQLQDAELYRTFNMGIGLIMIVAPCMAEKLVVAAQSLVPQFKLYEIGQVVSGERQVKLCG